MILLDSDHLTLSTLPRVAVADGKAGKANTINLKVK